MLANPLLALVPPRTSPPTKVERFVAYAILGVIVWIMMRDESTTIPTLSNPSRNIVNIDEIDAYIADFRGPFSEPVRHWLQSNFKNYLIREHGDIDPYERHFLEKADKKWVERHPWIIKAFDRGDALYQVNMPDSLTREVMHILDYFTSPEAPPRLDRISFVEALRQSQVWLEKITHKKVDEKLAHKGEKTIKTYKDGFAWKKLISRDALDLEGNQMGHCVGSYAGRVEAGSSIVYSLRDEKNKPHVTIEVLPEWNQVHQIRGKQNDPPIKKYWSYVKDFLGTTLQDVEVLAGELQNIGLYKFEGKVYDVEDLKKDKKIVLKKLSKSLNKEILLLVTEKMELTDDGIAITGIYLDELFTILTAFGARVGDYYTTKRLSEVLENFHDIEQRIEDHGYQVEELISSLEKKHPKTYKKIRKYIEILEQKTNSDYSMEPGKWFKRILLGHESDTVGKYAHHQLYHVLDALHSAISDGYHVGTSSSAYKFIKNLVSDLHWTDRSYTYQEAKEKDRIGFVLSWESFLSGDTLYLDESDRSKIDYEYRHGRGFDFEYDEKAAEERFYEALADTNFKLPD